MELQENNGKQYPISALINDSFPTYLNDNNPDIDGDLFELWSKVNAVAEGFTSSRERHWEGIGLFLFEIAQEIEEIRKKGKSNSV